jgi:hypothetical protein
MDCSDLRNDILDVLYDEATAETRRRLETHVASCPSCRDELQAFRALRSDLQRWKTPAARPFLARPAHRFPRLLAAAAALLVATGAGLGLAGSELRFEEGRFAFRLGRGPSEQVVREALLAQEARHQRELEDLRSQLRTIARPASGETPGDPLLQQVAELIRESEARQEERLAASLRGVDERVEARRRYDLARIGAGLAYLDGRNGQRLSRTTELMGHMLEATESRSER